MPADTDYDKVHPLTIGGDKYGCHSRKPFARHYWAPQRVFNPDGSFEIISVRVPFVMSRDCRSFYLWDTAKCAGCNVPKDEAYAERMKGMV